MELSTISNKTETVAELLDLCQTRLGMTASAAAAHVVGLLTGTKGARVMLAQDQAADATLALVARAYRQLPKLI